MIEYEDDDQLADAVEACDIAAQEAFFNRFRDRLIKFAISKGFSFEDADELAADALATGMRTIASFRRGEVLVRWLAGIEVNLMRQRWTKAKRSPEVVPLEDADEAAAMWQQRVEEMTGAEIAELARLWADSQLYMSLAPNQTHMDVVRMHYLDGLKYSEIESALGLAKNTAKVYAQRGLRYLRDRRAMNPPEEPTPGKGHPQ